MLTPEQQARQIIDDKLIESGWLIQDPGEMNIYAGPGVALRESLVSILADREVNQTESDFLNKMMISSMLLSVCRLGLIFFEEIVSSLIISVTR